MVESSLFRLFVAPGLVDGERSGISKLFFVFEFLKKVPCEVLIPGYCQELTCWSILTSRSLSELGSSWFLLKFVLLIVHE